MCNKAAAVELPISFLVLSASLSLSPSLPLLALLSCSTYA